MPLNSKIIISDTSCLILLSAINELSLLKKFSKQVFITQDIKNEFGKELPEWIIIKSPVNIHYQRILEIIINKGEASAIALCLEMENPILIIDDLKGRKTAEKLNLNYSGTFGIILRAKQEGIIPNVSHILEKIKKTNFRFSEALFQTILKEAGE